MWAPKYSDKIGRYPMIVLTYSVQTIALVGIYFSDSISRISIFMCLFGMSHPGRNIIFFNYFLEAMPTSYKEICVTWIMVLENIVIVFICISFQFITKDWSVIIYFGLTVSIISLFCSLVYLKESPKFFYNTKDYEKARQILNEISVYNGLNV